MHGLQTSAQLNTEITIKGILARAAARGLRLSREEVLEELKFEDDEDTSMWGATVDVLIRAQS